MKVEIQLNDSKDPMEYTTIEKVEKVEYRYNKTNEEYMLYLETESSFIAVPIKAIENIEIKEN